MNAQKVAKGGALLLKPLSPNDFHTWCAALTGNPLYPLARTGPVVPAHPGDDREQV